MIAEEKKIWKIREQLEDLTEENYKQFNEKLLPGVKHIIGVRLPALRKIAKETAKSNYSEYLNEAGTMFGEASYHEEFMVWGLVIAYIKADRSEVERHLDEFVPKINNWAVCDCFCSTLKDADKYQAEYWDFIETYFTSNKEYEARFAAVMLLGHFVKREYLKESIRRLESITQQGYYAKMAVAWAVSVYFAAFPDEMLAYLQDGHKLDEFTYKKSLQKITESYRVDKEMKKIIKEMRQRG